jgi:IclR family pca regulon transcriptional regulator
MAARSRKARAAAAVGGDRSATADAVCVEYNELRYSQSLQAGLAVLRCFTAARRVRGIADVGDETELGRSTTHRYMTTLATLGYVEHTSSSKYRLAPQAANLGRVVLDSQPVRRCSRERLRELREQTGYAVSLGVLEGTEVLYLERLPSYARGQFELDLGAHGLRVGCRVPAYCTAMGKLLLASLPELEQRKRIASLKLTRQGPRSIATKIVLREELQRTQATGLALSDRELTKALLSIAAPIRDSNGTIVAALALEAPTTAVTPEDLLRDTAPRLASTAERVSIGLELGGA